MGINIGNNNNFKNVTITEQTGDCAGANDKKSFAERHPVLIGLFCSFVISFIFLFSFWDEVIAFIERLF